MGVNETILNSDGGSHDETSTRGKCKGLRREGEEEEEPHCSISRGRRRAEQGKTTLFKESPASSTDRKHHATSSESD